MTDIALCVNNKFGYCKFGQTCKKKHVNQICDRTSCRTYNCEKRHPKKCLWYERFNRCKFSNCAYMHVKDIDQTELKEKIEKLDNKINEKEDEIRQQIIKIEQIELKLNNVEKHDKQVIDLESKVRNLEKFVVRLEEKIEFVHNFDPGDGFVYNEQKDYSEFDKLIRTKSLETICDQCEYKGRNIARVEKHKEVKHHHVCEPCGTYHNSDAAFANHNRRTHGNLDETLTEKDFNDLGYCESMAIQNGPDTPRKEDLIKRIQMKEQKEKEERRRERREKLEKEKKEKEEN
jgi:hypothetical protein